MADLPNGLDRADGLDGRVGTPTNQDAITIVTPFEADAEEITIEELPDSPEIERGEQCTIVHRYRMSWSEGISQISYYGYGTTLTDSYGNVSKVLNARIQHEKPDNAILTITCESISFDTPPDEFQINESELGVNIIKYPRYFYAFQGANPTQEALNQDVIRLLQNYFENTNSAYRDTLIFQLYWSLGYFGSLDPSGAINREDSFNPNDIDSNALSCTISPIAGTDFAKAAALEIVQKYWRNEETPYLIGYEIIWSSFYWIPQPLNPGGYVEDPIHEATPQLPDFFWSTDSPPGSNNIFQQFSNFNPQCYSSTGIKGDPVVISWLRKSDRMTYQRTWFKLERKWIGTPVGFWDADLYNQNSAPQDETEFNIGTIPEISAKTVSTANNPDIQNGTTLF